MEERERNLIDEQRKLERNFISKAKGLFMGEESKSISYKNEA